MYNDPTEPNETAEDKAKTKFICDLQELTAEEAISEIMCSSIPDEEILEIFREITLNDTFKFKK